jgi:single-strand DNA-binding protein
MNVNLVILAGNITRDIELRTLPSGQSIAQIGLAMNRKWKNKDGQPQEEVTFVDMEAWGKTAEVMHKYLGKGKPVHVTGRLKLDQWEDKESGQKRSKMKVVVESFEFVASAPEGERDVQQQPAKAGKTAKASSSGEIDPEDIPFGTGCHLFA